MKLKFLIDVGVGRAVEDLLRSNGYDMKAVRDIDPGAKDSDILDIAVSEGRMVVTMDKDFGELVHKLSMKHSLRRSPPAFLVGKGKIIGDIISPAIPETDWNCLDADH